MTRGPALLCALIAWGSEARAQGAERPTRVVVGALGCDALRFDRARWQALLRAELETDGVEDVRFEGAASDGGVGALATIALTVPECAAGADAVAVRIGHTPTGALAQRSVELGDLPVGERPRALALAVAELLRRSWSEASPAAAAPAVMPPPQPVVERPAVAPSPPPPPRWTVGAAFELRWFPGDAVVLYGARTRLAWAPWRGRRLRLVAELGVSASGVSDRLGDVALGMATGSVGAVVRFGSGRFVGEVGGVVEAGGAWVSGVALVAGAVGRSEAAALVLTRAVIESRLSLGSRAWVVLGASLGVSLRPVAITSGDQRVAGFVGPTGTVAVGLAWGG